jgi:hypothetical protein
MEEDRFGRLVLGQARAAAVLYQARMDGVSIGLQFTPEPLEKDLGALPSPAGFPFEDDVAAGVVQRQL